MENTLQNLAKVFVVKNRTVDKQIFCFTGRSFFKVILFSTLLFFFIFSSTFAQTVDSSLITEEITHTYVMVLIIIISVSFIAFVIIILLSKTYLFKKWTEKNKRKPSLVLNDLDVLGLKRIKKRGEFTKLKGVYKDKNVKISRFEQKNVIHGVGIIISAPFYDSYPLPKPKFIKSIFLPRSKLYFCLRKKRAGIKWSNFENTFKIRSKIAAEVLSEKNKLSLGLLFNKGYFGYVLNTSLTVETLYSEKSAGKKEGRVVFRLPINIVKDVDSLKIAMDIVVEIAEKIDKTAKDYKFSPNHSSIGEIKEDIR